MSIALILRLAGGCLLIVSNAFFVAVEFSLTRLRQYSNEEFQDDPRLKRAWEMTDKLEIYLTACQLGITLSSVMLGIVAEPALSHILQPVIHATGAGQVFSYSFSVILSIVFINLAHMVWAEQTPTYIGIEKAKSIARHFATPHYYWTKIMYPFIFTGDWITKRTLQLFGITMSRSWKESTWEEPSRGLLKDQIAEILKTGELPEDRQNEIIKAVEVGEIAVDEIMIPRADIAYLSTKNSLDENIGIIRNTMKNRYPLAGGSLDDFIGTLYTPEILGHITELQNHAITLNDLVHYHLMIPPGLKISAVIDRFQSNKQELALVRKNNKITGLITLTDALEVIIGSAEDPND